MFEQEGDAYVKKIGGVFAFKVKDGPGGKEAMWFVDVKNGKGCVHNDTGAPPPSRPSPPPPPPPCSKCENKYNG